MRTNSTDRLPEEVEGDLKAAAIARVKAMADGFKRIERGPIEPPELPEVDIGHLSTAVDAINQKAILDGAAMGLDGGLEFESQCFGECFALEDSRIGIENFMKNGPRSKAEFKNR